MNGLSGINIELSSKCNKSCHMCGRRKMERDHPELCDWGDMPLEMLARIAAQIPRGVFIQLHWNGEPLLYPKLDAAMNILRHHYKALDTNGILLMEKASAVCELNSVTISVIPDDPIGGQQLEIAEQFLELPDRPLTVFRLLGYIDNDRRELIESWTRLYSKVMIVKRILHQPEGSFGYEKQVVKPEIGICLEMLHKLAVDRYGNVYPCVRYDPHRKNILGNLYDYQLRDIWNGERRTRWLGHHMDGRRDRVPLCGESCSFWGIPRG